MRNFSTEILDIAPQSAELQRLFEQEAELKKALYARMKSAMRILPPDLDPAMPGPSMSYKALQFAEDGTVYRLWVQDRYENAREEGEENARYSLHVDHVIRPKDSDVQALDTPVEHVSLDRYGDARFSYDHMPTVQERISIFTQADAAMEFIEEEVKRAEIQRAPSFRAAL